MSDATQAAATPAAPAPDATAASPAAPAQTPAAPAAAPAAAAPAASPDGAAAPKPDDKPGEGKPAAGTAPEKYTDFTLPEGFKMDEPTLGKFTEWAKTNGLSQEAAQAAVDMASGMQKQAVEQMQAAFTEQSTKWATDAKGDKEFGGDKFDENLAVAIKARDQFGTPELKSFLDTSKLGNHPEVIRFFYRVGQAISQDGHVPGRQGAASGDPAKNLYRNMN